MKMKTKTFNKEILIQVRDFIIQNPEKFDVFAILDSCRTVGCIAGWAGVLTHTYPERPLLSGPVNNLSALLFGRYRTDEQFKDVNKLCHYYYWSECCKDKYNNEPENRHLIAAKVIDKFIKDQEEKLIEDQEEKAE